LQGDQDTDATESHARRFLHQTAAIAEQLDYEAIEEIARELARLRQRQANKRESLDSARTPEASR
jgi:hypothetical protein